MKFEISGTEIDIDTSLISEDDEEIRKQLQEYKKGERKNFNLDIIFPESFTGKVMHEISKIPYGKTQSYGKIAESLDSAAVAVGQACGRNPAPIIIPCHRVVGKNSLGGYIYGQELKQKLHNHESDF